MSWTDIDVGVLHSQTHYNGWTLIWASIVQSTKRSLFSLYYVKCSTPQVNLCSQMRGNEINTLCSMNEDKTLFYYEFVSFVDRDKQLTLHRFCHQIFLVVRRECRSFLSYYKTRTIEFVLQNFPFGKKTWGLYLQSEQRHGGETQV